MANLGVLTFFLKGAQVAINRDEECRDLLGRLQEIHRPIGVASYTTTLIESLPQDLKCNLPSTEQLEVWLSKTKLKQKDKTKK